MKYNKDVLNSYAKGFFPGYSDAKKVILWMLILNDVFGVLINIYLFIGIRNSSFHLAGKTLIAIIVLDNLYSLYFFIKYRNYKTISEYNLCFGILSLSLSFIFMAGAFSFLRKAYNYIPVVSAVIYLIMYAVAAFIPISITRKRFVGEKKNKNSSAKISAAVAGVGGMGGLGIELSKLISSHVGEKLNSIFISFLCLVFALFWACALVLIYTYFVVKKYSDYEDEKF